MISYAVRAHRIPVKFVAHSSRPEAPSVPKRCQSAPYFNEASHRGQVPTFRQRNSAEEAACQSDSRRKAVGWSKQETMYLLEIRKSCYERFQAASNKEKKKIWLQILASFQDECTANGVFTGRNLGQIKKRIQNLEYEFKQVRKKLSSGEKDTLRIKAAFPYYDVLNETLRLRDSSEQHRMNSEPLSIELTAKSPPGSCESSHFSRRSTGTPSVSDESLGESSGTTVAADEIPIRGTKRKTDTPAAKGTKRIQSSSGEENSFLVLWERSLAQENERFQKLVELQQNAIRMQMEQTNVVLAGLRDIFKDLLREISSG